MPTDAISRHVDALIAPESAAKIRIEQGRILSSLPAQDEPRSKRFEGLYGHIYNRVIQTPALRKAAFSLWGSADPLYDLERFVSEAVQAASTSPGALIVDVPSGGGTLLPFLERERFRGSVVEVDLAAPMLARALALHARLAPAFETVFLRSDALDLPLRNAVADVVVSINGLHVVDDHSRFLSEIARVTKAGGKLWLITPVDGESIRSRLILAAANAIGVTPRTPPSRPALLELVHAAGFTVIRDYGGSSIAGFAAEKR